MECWYLRHQQLPMPQAHSDRLQPLPPPASPTPIHPNAVVQILVPGSGSSWPTAHKSGFSAGKHGYAGALLIGTCSPAGVSATSASRRLTERHQFLGAAGATLGCCVLRALHLQVLSQLLWRQRALGSVATAQQEQNPSFPTHIFFPTRPAIHPKPLLLLPTKGEEKAKVS